MTCPCARLTLSSRVWTVAKSVVILPRISSESVVTFSRVTFSSKDLTVAESAVILPLISSKSAVTLSRTLPTVLFFHVEKPGECVLHFNGKCIFQGRQKRVEFHLFQHAQLCIDLVLRFLVQPALFVVSAALGVLCVTVQPALFVVSAALCVLLFAVCREDGGPFLVQAL